MKTKAASVYVNTTMLFILLLTHSGQSLGKKPEKKIVNDPCKDAKVLLNSQLYAEALAAFKKLRTGQTTLKCAEKGLNETRVKAAIYYNNKGAAFYKAGKADKAIEQYTKTLELISEKTEVKDKQKEAEQTIKKILLSPVILYVEKEDYEKARSHLNTLITDGKVTNEDITIKEIAKEEIENEEIAKKIGFLLNDKELFFKKLSAYWAEWGEIVTVLLIAGVIGFIFLRLLRYVRHPLLHIENIDDEAVTTKGTTAFAAMIRTRLFRLTESAESGTRINQITKPVTKFQLPAEIQEVLPPKFSWVKIFPWMFSQIFKRDVVKLTGYLQAPGKRGPGVTLQLTKNGALIKSETLWQEDFVRDKSVDKDEKISTYYRLSDYGTIWLLYKLPQRFMFKKSISLLGASDWYSCSLFRAAMNAEKDGGYAEAKSLYLEAMKKDPHFHAAKVNLAVLIDKMYDDQKNFKIELVQHVVEQLYGKVEEKVVDIPTLYTAWKNLVVWTYEKGEKEDIIKANKELGKLLDDIDKKYRYLFWVNNIRIYSSLGAEKILGFSWFNQYTDLQRYIGTIRPQLEAIYAGLMIELGVKLNDPGKIEDGKALLKQLDENILGNNKFIYGLQYNLACTYTILAGTYLKTNTEECEKNLKLAINCLRRAYELGDDIDKAKHEDPSLALLRNHPITRGEFQSILDLLENKQPDKPKSSKTDPTEDNTESTSQPSSSDNVGLEQIVEQAFYKNIDKRFSRNQSSKQPLVIFYSGLR